MLVRGFKTKIDYVALWILAKTPSYPWAQFFNELSSVGEPVLSLVSQRGISKPIAVITAFLAGGFAGINTYFISDGYQRRKAAEYLQNLLTDTSENNEDHDAISVPEENTKRFPSLSWKLLGLMSCLITVAQWNFNNIFLWGQLKKNWWGSDLDEWDAVYVSALYIVTQLTFDWHSDALEGINGLLKKNSYTGNFAELMPACFGVPFRSRWIRNGVRLSGAVMHAIGRIIPVVYKLSPQVEGFPASVSLISVGVGLPVILQDYLFEGGSVEDNLCLIAQQPVLDSVPFLPPLIAVILKGFLWFGGILDGLDTYLGPYEFCLALGKIFEWPGSEEIWDKLAIIPSVIIAFIVGLSGAYVEAKVAHNDITKITLPRGKSRGINNCWAFCTTISDEASNPHSEEDISVSNAYLPLPGGDSSEAVISPAREAQIFGAGRPGVAVSAATVEQTARRAGSVSRAMLGHNNNASGGSRASRSRRTRSSNTSRSSSSSERSKKDEFHFDLSLPGSGSSPKR